ncbi:uncharacterized protein LOC120486614 [Pimephales promelas]|uniref:uncharacterized protein LOC120486614 n=1 Tax=Pimephales promelas TaxID=90988 RepID=UPI00195597E3|nr:uncharacterized protein LOC120486614 [Pimephales promelas]
MMEGDSVTLYTGVQTKQQEDIKWYFKDTRIAHITGDLSKICTDVQCNGDTERFRDRLKLDHQTGSLTITHTTNKHSGPYQLKIFSSSNSFEKIFSVTSQDVPASERDEMKRKSVMEGESVTLDPAVNKNPNDVMMWYYNDTRLAEITGEPSKICTDVHSDERFRDRLKLDHQTGSLTITHTTNTHSGEYTLQINSSSFSIKRSFTVSVTDVPDSGLSSGAVVGICVAVGVILLLLAPVIYWKRRSKDTGIRRSDRANGVNCLMSDSSHTSSTQTEQI